MKSGLAALAAMALLVLSGCGSAPSPDMTLEISFDGQGCRDAGLDEVSVRFETGNVGDVTVPCDTRGPLRVVVEDVPIGVYRVLVTGLDQGFAIYALRVEIEHRRSGPHVYGLDLRLATEVIAQFTFAGVGLQNGLTCDEAGIEFLDISFGDLTFDTVPCRSGGQDAALLLGITPGRYDVAITAFDSQGRDLYESFFDDVDVFDGSNVLTFNVLPLVPAELEFRWIFDDTARCDRSGVVTVEYVLIGPDGARVSANPEVALCGDQGHVWGPLAAGRYVLQFIEGIDGAGRVLYRRTSVPLFAPAGDRAVFDVNLLPF